MCAVLLTALGALRCKVLPHLCSRPLCPHSESPLSQHSPPSPRAPARPLRSGTVTPSMSEPVVRLLSRVTPPWCQECRALCFLRCSRLHARHTHGEAGHGPAVVTAPRRLPKKRKLRPNQRTQTRLLPQPHPSPARPAPPPRPRRGQNPAQSGVRRASSRAPVLTPPPRHLPSGLAGSAPSTGTPATCPGNPPPDLGPATAVADLQSPHPPTQAAPPRPLSPLGLAAWSTGGRQRLWYWASPTSQSLTQMCAGK